MALPSRSQVTTAIVNYLSQLPKGELVKYPELSKIAGVKLIPASGKLISARRILLQEHNQVWDCIRPRVGIKRLNDAEMARKLPDWHLRGAGRKIRRGRKMADKVEVPMLDKNEQSRFAVASIQASLAADALSKATTRKLEQTASGGSSNSLPAFNAIEWALSIMPSKRKTKEKSDV